MKLLLIALGRLLLMLRYRITVKGLEGILDKGKGGLLFLPNHPSLMDPVILFTTFYPRLRPRTLADRDRIGSPLVARLADVFGAIPMRDPGAYGAAARGDVERAMAICGAALDQGENVLMYPAGHLQKHRLEELGGNSAVETLLSLAPNTRVVMVRTRGLWGSRFSWASGRRPELGRELRPAIWRVLANLVFFLPRREVVVECVEPADFPREGGRVAQNRFLEAFFNQEAPPATYVPLHFLEGGGVREIPEHTRASHRGAAEACPEEVREKVLAHLLEVAGVSRIDPEAHLARDLGLDSLARLELSLWLEEEFRVEPPSPENLETVCDVCLAASGISLEALQTLHPIDPSWFITSPQPTEILPAETVLEAMVRQAQRNPKRALLADQTSGMRTYGDLLTGVCVLAPFIQAMEGRYIGIMLPASVGATVLYFAVLASGKIPVMINWTVGTRSLQHGLDLLDVRCVLTAKALLTKLDAQGLDLGPARERMVLLEELRGRIGTLAKLKGALRARFGLEALARTPIPETAVVLFTSGSESYPKAVPLTHRNLMVNVADTIQRFKFRPSDVMMSCLPPFHSMGLMGTVVLPCCIGTRTAYHTNPTEGAVLARLIEAYRCTVLPGTPTFLGGIVRVAEDPQLTTLRAVISGAEKCPTSLFDTLARRFPRLVVVEGYGITECSPILAANREEAPLRGSMGYPLERVRLRIVHPETLEPVAKGEKGLLLASGPSIFPGYLGTEALDPFVELDGVRWYRTGDLVREREDGALEFQGRLKRFVKLGGEMVSLPAVEEALLAAFPPGEDEGPSLAVESTPAEQNPDLVLFTTLELTREAANGALKAAGLSPLHFVKEVRRIEAIPLLGTGKTDYRSLKALLG